MKSKHASFSRRDFLAGTAVTAAALAAASSRPLFAQAGGDKKLGWVLVGIGSLSKGQLLPAFAKTKNCKLVGIVTGHPQENAGLAAQHGFPASSIYTYETYEKLKDNPDVDVIYIVLPNDMHKEYVVRGSKLGKHVFCEKPMANSPADCQIMIDAMKASGKKFMIGYRMQYDTATKAAIEVVRDPAFGPIKQIFAECNANRVNDDPAKVWRINKPQSGGGALMDMGIYALQATRYLSGDEPAQVQAFTYTTPGIKAFTNIEETISINLKFKKGAIAQVVSSYGFASHRARVEGNRGGLFLEPLMNYSGNKVFRVRGNQLTEVPYVPQDHFATEMDHFADCVINNKEPKTTGEEGLRDMKIIAAAYESAATGKVIELG